MMEAAGTNVTLHFFKSTLRWSLKENRKDAERVTHAVVKTIAAFLNTEGGDLIIGVNDAGEVVGRGGVSGFCLARCGGGRSWCVHR